MKVSSVLILYSLPALGEAFAPSNSLSFGRPSANLFSTSDSYDTNPIHSDLSFNPLLSPREARLVLPLLTVLSQTFPQVAQAKSSSPEFENALTTYFPGSIPSTTVLLRVQSTLRKRQYFPYNTLLATSLSSDEVLNTPTSIINLLRNKLSESKDGGVYSLGGLAGIPFAGDAGMDDLLSHAPKDGRIIILFAPQVNF